MSTWYGHIMLRQTWSFIENHDILEINLSKIVMTGYSGDGHYYISLRNIRIPEKFQNIANSFLYNLTIIVNGNSCYHLTDKETSIAIFFFCLSIWFLDLFLYQKQNFMNIIVGLPGVDLRKKINWPLGPVKFLNNWPLQNSTGPRNFGPLCGPI